MRGASASVGRIVFLTLLCMSIGAAAIGFVAVFGVQSIRHEFEHMVEADLPQATIATRLNAEVSGLTSQIGLLLTARSEIALGTIRIQTDDQLDAINRQKERLRDFELRSGEYAEIEGTLTALVENLDALTTLGIRKLRSQAAFRRATDTAGGRIASSDDGSYFLAWVQDVDAATRLRELDQLAERLDQMTDPELRRAGSEILSQRRVMLDIDTTIEGRLNQHTQLSARLTDATRFMSSRLISEANARSASIQSLIQTNLYLILACFLAFATVGAFIYIYLDKHVVGRIQQLTRKMNAYDGHALRGSEVRNEITQMEASFANLTDAIDERESRLVALSEAATEARRDAEKANQSKSTLLAAASHDLRQPIHAMGLLIGGIDRVNLTAQSRETVDQLAGLTQETIRLFNSILDLSKLESGTFTATQVPVDLNAVFARIAAEFQPRAQLAAAALTITMPDPNTFVRGDEDALYRILSNLLVNAIVYAQQGTITVRCDIEGDVCNLIVADNGPGLHLKVEMTQTSGDGSEAKGYGLGLSISFALAAAMHSKLTFTLPQSGGTRFALPLPLSTPPERSDPSKNPFVAYQGETEGPDIIFLEDNPDIHAATVKGLTRLGWSVTAFSASEDARMAIDTAEAPFILISDIDLGRGHSADSIIIEALDHAPDLVAVIVTTATRLDPIESWSYEKRVQIIEKPFAIARLASLIRFVAR